MYGWDAIFRVVYGPMRALLAGLGLFVAAARVEVGRCRRVDGEVDEGASEGRKGRHGGVCVWIGVQ